MNTLKAPVKKKNPLFAQSPQTELLHQSQVQAKVIVKVILMILTPKSDCVFYSRLMCTVPGGRRGVF